MHTILIVDDEPAIRESLAYALERDGFKAFQACALKEAAEYIDGISLIILDVMLPDGNGVDFLKKLRINSRVPVILLTSRDEEIDRVVGLEVGADDYVTKPFSPREVVARVKAVLRRMEVHHDDNEKLLSGPGSLKLNPATRCAAFGNNKMDLSKTEFDLLSALMQSPGRVYERAHLLQKIWGPDCIVGDRTIDVHLKSLRKKNQNGGRQSWNY